MSELKCQHGSGWHYVRKYKWWEWMDKRQHACLVGEYKPTFLYKLFRRLSDIKHHFVMIVKLLFKPL